jgi:hypothetical protein
MNKEYMDVGYINVRLYLWPNFMRTDENTWKKRGIGSI